MGFDFTVIVPLLLSHCGFFFVFGCGVSFLVSSSVFLSMSVQQLVVILVFSQEGVRVHPSTPPYWFQSPCLVLIAKVLQNCFPDIYILSLPLSELYIYVYMCVCVHIYVCANICIYVYVYICIYIIHIYMNDTYIFSLICHLTNEDFNIYLSN